MMIIWKMMALLLLCAPMAAAYADDLAEGNGVTGSNDQSQFPKTKGEAKRYLTRRAAEGLGIRPKIEYRFAPIDSTGENKRVARSLDFGAHADPRESWRKIEFCISLKDSFGENRQAVRSIEFKVNADLRTSWRIEFRMAIK